MSGGMDQGTDSKLVQMGKLRLLENGEFPKAGQVGKPFGFEQLSSTVIGGSTQLTSAKRLATFEDELLQVASGKLYSYVPSSDVWVDKGYVSTVSVSTKPIVRNTASQSAPDLAVSQGVAVYAWEDSRGGVRATVVDLESGAPLQSDVLISSTGSRPRVSATPSYLYVHYMDSANTFKCKRLNPLLPLTFDAAITLASDANATTPHFDIAPFGNNLVFCYHTTGNIVTTGYLKSTGNIAGVTDGFPASVNSVQSGSGAVAICARFQGDGDDGIYTFYHNTTNGLNCIVYGTNLTTIATTQIDPTTSVVNQIGAVAVGATAQVFYEMNAAASYNTLIKHGVMNRAGTLATAGAVFVRSIGLASKPFTGSDGETYFVGVHKSDFQPTYFTVRRLSTTRGLVTNTIVKDEAGGLHTKRSILSNVYQTSSSSTEFLFPALNKTRLVSESGSVFGLVGVLSAELSFDDSDLYASKQLGKNLHITGGLLQDYDGKGVFEHGYLLFPENISYVAAAAGSMEAGARQYCVVFEWTDSQGQIHESAPSIPLEATNTINQKNTLTIPTLRLTERRAAGGQTEVSVAIYRTKINGTTFYRVSSITSPLANDTTADTVTYEDTQADTAIGANQVLYTSGAVLENVQPRSAKVIASYNDRLFIDSEDAGEIQFSKRYSRGTALHFNEEFRARADQGGSRVRTIAKLDERLIIFKDAKILVTAGEGPNDQGSNYDYRTPLELPADVGCPHPESVVETPLGLFFKSKGRGIYLLDRALNVSPIGREVEDYNALTLTSATLLEDIAQVRFTHSDGPTLVYDYEEKQWSISTGLEAESAVLWQGSYVVLKTDGTVLKRSSSTYLMAGATVKTRIKLPWIKAAGLKGAQRIYKILCVGELKSAHKLRVSVSYDFIDSPEEVFVFDTATQMGSAYFGSEEYAGAEDFFGGVDEPYEFEIQPARQKCQAISLEIEDLNPDAIDGGGFTLAGLIFQIGAKTGPHRVASTKRVGSS